MTYKGQELETVILQKLEAMEDLSKSLMSSLAGLFQNKGGKITWVRPPYDGQSLSGITTLASGFTGTFLSMLLSLAHMKSPMNLPLPMATFSSR